MTRDEIIRLAVECQLVTTGHRDGLYMDALERFASAVAQAELAAMKVGVPDGWQLVPKEPTLQMISAAVNHYDSSEYNGSKSTYQAMLAAAPKPGEE